MYQQQSKIKSKHQELIETFFREEVQEFFDTMDRDFDERLTFEEFMGEESHIEKVFKNMDKNGDGFVTKEEFQSVCKNLTDEQVGDW